MFIETIDLPMAGLGGSHSLTVFRFGRQGARPKVYVQGALHADEIPGMITAHHLCQKLKELDEAGLVMGEIVVVPVANPIGLTQTMLGSPIGRFAFDDGGNFNRGYPDLAPAVARRVERALGPDEAANMALIREALKSEAAAIPAVTQVEALKRALLMLAIDSDIVLDLHCDSEAAMHLYTLTPHAERCEPLSRYLGCEAMLLATESGDNPFDEASSRPWLDLQKRFPAYPIPLPCLAVTVELRGQRDVSDDLAGEDAEAIIDFLIHEGAIAGTAKPLPPARCEPTLLASTEPLTAPVAGIILFQKSPGDVIESGDLVAELIDPIAGKRHAVKAVSGGVLFARTSLRFAQAGRRLGKIAGHTLQRTGNLLSP
ncbi:MAG: succinylglutamate desuccinylase/aspartoacylase family protein [Beijerinckiaceae bacterium]|nr:succinylglutamate desuccinylase/aspartoacylase family protein [Beijerinckiaceae bacterium]